MGSAIRGDGEDEAEDECSGSLAHEQAWLPVLASSALTEASWRQSSTLTSLPPAQMSLSAESASPPASTGPTSITCFLQLGVKALGDVRNSVPHHPCTASGGYQSANEQQCRQL